MKFSKTTLVGAALGIATVFITALSELNNENHTREIARDEIKKYNDQPEEETEDSATTEDN